MASKSALGLTAFVLSALVAVLIVLFSGEPEAEPPRPEPPAAPPPEPEPVEPPPVLEPSAPALAAHGVVFDRDGQPAPAGVIVHSATQKTTTRADGHFSLPLSNGRIEVRALDPRTGDIAGPRVRVIKAGFPTDFMLLELRPSFLVTGRVVDGNGRPVAGAGVHAVSDGENHRTTVYTGAGGRFSARLRYGSAGSAAAFDKTGLVGPIRRFEPSKPGEMDIGDLVLGFEEMTTWTLTFECIDGRPVDGGRVGLSSGHPWNERLHPRYDRKQIDILPDLDGRVCLTVPCQPDPARVTFLSDSHLGRIVTIDCSRPGPQEATVLLRPKPAIRVRLVGPAAAALLGNGAELRVGVYDRERKSRYLIPVTDVRTGEVLSLSPDDQRWRRRVSDRDRGPAAARGEDGLFVIRTPRPGRYKVHLVTGTWSMVIGDVTIDTTTHGQVVELTVPRGRHVMVDCRKLLAWARENGIESWVPTYAAQPDEIADDAPFCPMPGPTLLFGSKFIPRLDRHAVWVPEGFKAIAFSFPTKPDLTVEAGLSPGGVVTIGDRRRIEAPIPHALLSMMVPVRVGLMREGKTFRQAGIAIRVGRSYCVTDDDGCVRIHLLPGRYRYGIEDVGSRSGWPIFEVRLPSEPILIDLEFEYPRYR